MFVSLGRLITSVRHVWRQLDKFLAFVHFACIGFIFIALMITVHRDSKLTTVSIIQKSFSQNLPPSVILNSFAYFLAGYILLTICSVSLGGEETCSECWIKFWGTSSQISNCLKPLWTSWYLRPLEVEYSILIGFFDVQAPNEVEDHFFGRIALPNSDETSQKIYLLSFARYLFFVLQLLSLHS